jgi:hypothetical protein
MVSPRTAYWLAGPRGGLGARKGGLGARNAEASREMLLQKMCSRVSTFEVKATLVGDLHEWMTITLDDAHASTVVGQSASSCPCPPLCGRK